MFGIVYLPPHGHTSYFACYQFFFFSFRHIKHASSGKSLKLLFFSFLYCLHFLCRVGVNAYNGFCVNGPSVDKTGETWWVGHHRASAESCNNLLLYDWLQFCRSLFICETYFIQPHVKMLISCLGYKYLLSL